ncbi:membrane protein insertase YidC [Robertkochia marina]|uniref:Membrane protein insertase YidC n=1 Tax=Robertkochia marina TaxID=1227945 RepID=A0A4S3LX16_9FLAO|nr:membrane protein insertase YidC [Robertkochia marina]THD65724.1 membrane protein insertase YidC [Robertkochia marina]TRZ46591.1 membrane protein insertase YidC [Robertkochia marina]
MEEKKFDINSLIGFLLIGAILIWVMYNNQPTPEEAASEGATTEQVEATPAASATQEAAVAVVDTTQSDSLALEKYKASMGAFAYGMASGAGEGTTVIENDVVKLTVNNKGGQITEAVLKEFHTYDSVPVYLVKDGNAEFNLTLGTTDNRTLNTGDLYFEPVLSENGDNKVLSMRLKAGENKYLEYRYELKPGDYLVDFTVRSQGLNGILNSNQEVKLDWNVKALRQNKSIEYENRYTRLTYSHDGDISKLGQMGDDSETETDLKWISYRQHFFSTILASKTPFKTASLYSENLVEEESDTAKYTKLYKTQIPLEIQGGELTYNMHWYYGPTDLKVFKKYEEFDFEDSVPFGWGIFGFINKHVFTPLYDMLSSVLPYGIAIVVMTILVRIVLSPVTYKSYLSQAKMKVLRPEITEINEKFKDNPMKRQQETMKLYGKAGVSPMSGCVPALLQLPIFYALFMFFPTAIMLRQKKFLWAEDLSSYDVIAELPFTIPFYGDHVSLFPILASVAIFFYMRMTTGQQQMMQQPTQEGMPDMGKLMKMMLYISPLLMLFFFNNYASGLSLYYFISNLITIVIMLVIKNYIIDEDKIHNQIQENKKKPKKESKFQRKMREMMEQAEEQKKRQGK